MYLKNLKYLYLKYIQKYLTPCLGTTIVYIYILIYTIWGEDSLMTESSILYLQVQAHSHGIIFSLFRMKTCSSIFECS